MKIVCDACSAKYSIADDKVKGKVFKIRCKKCSNIIVVRGTAGAGGAEEPAPAQFDQKDTRVYDYGYDEAGGPPPGGGDEAVWHLVIDQEQVGPLTVAEVGEKFAGGQIDAESFVWREGFTDWQPLSSVDAFIALVSGGGAPRGGGGADAVASMFGSAAPEEGGTMRSDPGDLFGARGGDAAPADDAGDLFGARASAPAASATAIDGGAGKAGKAAPAAAAAADGKLRGERNENSVLFSLGNLAALASDSPRASAASSSSSSGGGGGGASASAAGGAAQHGGGEGSGLIDIRSMAGAYLGDRGSAKKPASSVGSIDDLPVFSSASFHEPAVILPSQAPRQNNKMMMILIAAVGALALIAVILVLVVFLGGKSSSPPPTTVAANNGTGSSSGSNKPALAGGGSSSASGVTPGTGSSSGTAAASGTTPGTGSSSGSAAASGASTGTGAGTASSTGSSATPPESGGDKSGGDKSDGDKGGDKSDHHHHDKPDKPDKPDHGDKGGGDKGGDKGGGDKGGDSGGSCPDEVGCLLSEHPPACCSKYSKGKKTGGSKGGGGDKSGGGDTGGGGDMAESLDSDMIKAGVAGVKSRIFGCGDKYPSAKGTVKVHVKVNPAGSVTDASASQTPDPGLGSCASAAMKGAHFQKTQRGGTFSYPFNF